MTDACFRERRGPGVAVRVVEPRPVEHGGELLVATRTWMGHWTMERALRLLDPFQGSNVPFETLFVPLGLLGRWSRFWLAEVASTARRDGPWTFEEPEVPTPGPEATPPRPVGSP